MLDGGKRCEGCKGLRANFMKMYGSAHERVRRRM